MEVDQHSVLILVTKAAITYVYSKYGDSSHKTFQRSVYLSIHDFQVSALRYSPYLVTQL